MEGTRRMLMYDKDQPASFSVETRLRLRGLPEPSFRLVFLQFHAITIITA